MVKLFSFSLIMAASLVIASPDDIRFYRSEEDFRRGIQLSEKQLGWKSYLEVQYNDRGDVTEKYYYKRKNKLDRFEHFEYDSVSDALALKTVFSPDSTRLRHIVFDAKEEMSVKFIRYTYGVRRVQDFDDRFTSIEYDADGKPKVYRFFDVDGFLYGVIQLTYDENGHLRQEDWITMPTNDVVRRYVKDYNPDTGETEVWEYDSTLTLVNHMTVGADGLAPIITVTFPRDSLFVNTSQLSYTLLEGLNEGEVRWEWLGGKPDTLAPHIALLIESEMTRGDHSFVTLRNAPTLLDSAVYRLKFTGMGESGYPAISIVTEYVSFDTTAPAYTVDGDLYVSSPTISYFLDESLVSAEVLWVWERGEKDPSAPHIVGLSSGMLTKGSHESMSFDLDVQLNEETVYTVLFQGKDIAGNPGSFLTISGITYDTTAPVITWVQPDTGGHVNSSVVNYSLTEDLSIGEIIWEHTDGNEDSLAPHVISLAGSETDEGKHQYIELKNVPNLLNGAVYRLKIFGTDLAGNESDTLVIPNVTYDRVPPSVTAYLPQPASAVKNGELIYSLSEDFGSAEVEWLEVEREIIDTTYVRTSLDKELLTKGDHRLDDPQLQENLRDGATYIVRLTGRDLAGNEAVPYEIDDVTFDITPPAFSDIHPMDSSFVSSAEVSYSLSEDIAQGAVMWSQVVGNYDPQSPHMVNFTGKGLSAGEHTSDDLEELPQLQDGAIYEVAFMGLDRAGNRSTGAVSRHVIFDTTPPEIQLSYPGPDSHIPSSELSYSASELLAEGTVRWVWTGGTTDDNAPHVVHLAADELEAGSHERIVLSEIPDLVSGAIYTISIDGKDFSGKHSPTVEVKRVTFDNIQPELTLISPSEAIPVNSSDVNYLLSESLFLAEIVWLWTGGKEDPLSPHTVELAGDELLSGEHGEVPLVNSPSLMDGASYEIQFFGQDSAGNLSDTITIADVFFDKTPPEFQITYPVAFNPTGSFDVAYSVSEELFEGYVTWQWTGGAQDEKGSHIQNISGDELGLGEHSKSALASSPPELVEGGIYSVFFTGRDKAGNVTTTSPITGILYDATAPTFSDISPSQDGFINSSEITYRLSEPVQEGTVTWKRTGGVEDPISPHIVYLSGDELSVGFHENIILSDAPLLQDGGLYTISFVGRDFAQNISDTTKVENVLYDISSPVIEATWPTPDIYVSDPRVSYSLSEDLAEGNITWEQIGGTVDLNSPHIQILSGEELNAGPHLDIKLINAPVLNEKSLYTLSFSGKDRAGNEAEPIVIDNVTFDATAPFISDVAPANGSYVNDVKMSYWLSETMSEGTVIWESIGGAEDIRSPHMIKLMGIELLSGTFPSSRLEESPILIDSTIYSIKIAGSDAAGNASDTVRVDSITYDITSPIFTVTFPEDNDYISSSTINYSLSEDVIEATVTWERTGGELDVRSPHRIQLDNEQLTQGEHPDFPEEKRADLKDGAIYSLIVKGLDRAGNYSSPVIIQGIMFDASSPTITELTPDDSSYLNHSKISYTLSESLSEGFVTWIQTGGMEDLNSPHVEEMVESEMSKGRHKEVVLTNRPILQDGAIYSVSIFGKDPAGNQSDTVSIIGIVYDVSSPIFQVDYPVNDTYISDSRLIYTLNEDLVEGAVTWEREEGMADPNAPHELILKGSELSEGIHDGLLTDVPALVDGTTYAVSFNGRDKAGNSAETVKISGLAIDATPPVLTISHPQLNSFINNYRLSFSISENLNEGTIMWKQTGGMTDSNSPHELILIGDELIAGEHVDVALEHSPTLSDSAVYTIYFFGIDFAGNISDTVMVENVFYDVTPPVFTVTSPNHGDFIGDPRVAYTLSEPLREGTVVWTWESGSSDPNTPQVANLTLSELEAGDHPDHLISDVPQLINGAVYTISFSVIDSAGNRSEEVVIENVTFDRESPSISVIAPEHDAFRDNTFISYSLSESLTEGSVTWSRTGGSLDESSPHVIEMAGDEMSAGDHFDILLSRPFDLQDGTIYSIEFRGRDRAGNEADPVMVNNILFDVAPPVYVISAPDSGSYIKNTVISYEISEELKEATLMWERTGGEADPGSPHTVSLAGTDIRSGDHPDISLMEAPDLVNGSVYSLSFRGIDLAGNEGELFSVSGLTYDDVSPVISVLEPTLSAFTNSPRVSYTLSENLSSGHITWTRIGGNADPNSPHELHLTGDELIEGEHLDLTLSEMPTLQDGSTYDIAFQGQDLANNEAEPILITEVTYDVTLPEFTLSSPSNESAVNSLNISYQLSEELKSGIVTWERTGGMDDPQSPHISNLTFEERTSGIHEDILLSELPKLQDGGIYTVSMSGEDRAGNIGDTVTVSDILFDVTPPVIVANYPAPSSIVNSTIISYSLSETLLNGSVTWTRTSGSPDPESPHIVELSEVEMTEGDHQETTLSLPPELENGAIYSITFDGADAAGNKASGMVIESVTFDNEVPLLSLQIHENKAVINEPKISYSLSEDLSQGKMTWSLESGAEDPNSPHIIELLGEELVSGEHSAIILTNSPQLYDGSTYAITFSGTDLAGNEADSVSVSGIRYDITLPVLSLESPIENTAVNNLNVSFSLSETLAEGKAIWTQTGGVADPESPHVVILTESELAQGMHEEITFANQTPLIDGAIYTLTMSGLDSAGNSTEEVTATGISYDVTLPLFSQITPLDGSFVNSRVISYTLSEALSEGEIIWRQIGGSEDGNSPHTVQLSGDELTSGRHESIVLVNMPELVSGASYSISFSGEDVAGNSSEPLEVGSVVYDDISPVFNISTPNSSSWVNHTRVSYELSETLESGTITWTPKERGSPLVATLSGAELDEGVHADMELTNPPKLEDSKIYDIAFEGKDFAGNESEIVLINDITYDVTIPRIKITFDSPAKQTFVYGSPINLTNSEDMSEITFTWARETGGEDPNSPHALNVEPDYLVSGEHPDVIVLGSENILVGTVYTLTVEGKDRAGNESKRQTVEKIDIIRYLEGEWLWKGALLTAVWSFTGKDDFSQGVKMGTSITNVEPGKYSIDFSKRPFELRIKFDSGVKRYAIFEFLGQNRMRVVTSEKRPKSWTDGDLMEFEFSQPEVP